MAVLTIPDENRSLTDPSEITAYLAYIGIDYERWEADAALSSDAPADEILAAYAPQIEQLKAHGHYVTADVIDVNAAKMTVTLRGPKQTVDLVVPDPEFFKHVAKGDQVEATYTEALAVMVEPTPK